MVSIIVSIYNVKKFLDDCIGSILRSTYRDLELILVDDGSTDGSDVVCDQWAAKDDRVNVIHQVNARIAGARNKGLSMARGEYVLFVDGDDFVHPRMVETLVEAIHSGDYDLAMVYGTRVNEEDVPALAESLTDDKPEVVCQDVNKKELLLRLFDLTTFQYQVVWNKLYKKSLLEGLTFKQVASEDMEWNTQVFLKANKAALVEQDLYYYVQHNASIMHKGLNRSALDRFSTVMMGFDEIPEEYRTERANCLVYLYKSFFYVRYKCAERKLPFHDDVKSMGRQIYAYTGKELWRAGLPFKDKLNIYGFYHFPSLYKLLMSRLSQ